jgi:hypothetical protein
MTRHTPNWLQQGTYPASIDRDVLGFYSPTPRTTGCAVTVSSAMTVNIAPGQVAVPTANNTGTVLCTSDAVEQVTLTAAPASGTNRYDLIICQARGNDLDGGSNNDFIFTMVTGTGAASPTIPAVPNNAALIAHIYIPGGSASVTAGNITDRRLTGIYRSWRSVAWTTSMGGVVGMDIIDAGPSYPWTQITNAFTIPVAGSYNVNAVASFVASAAAQFGVLTIQVNTAAVFSGMPVFAQSNGNVIGGMASCLLPNLAAGNYIQMYLQASNAGLTGSTGKDRFQMTVQGPL